MVKLKRLLAVIVMLCLMAVFTVPAFSATTKPDVDICKELGMIQGTGSGVTPAYLASPPTRYQGAILFLRLLGLEDEAKAFTPVSNFSDLDGVSVGNRAIIGYLKANPDLGFEGVGNNMFDPLATMTARQYYKVLLVALGYKYNVEFTWNNVFQFAAEKGIYKLVDNTIFTISDMCTGTVEALKAIVKGGNDTLLARLVKDGAITERTAEATGLYASIPKVLQITDVIADNFKTVKVVFNKELNKDTIKAANFAIDGIDYVSLLDDGSTVAVVMADGSVTAQNTKRDITIKNVRSSDGMTIPETKRTVEFIDTTVPALTGAAALNGLTVVVSATEPINENSVNLFDLMDNIKIDNESIIAKSSSDPAKNTVTFILNAAYKKGVHTISISGLRDYAGYVAPAKAFNIDIPEDNTAPSIVSAVMNSNREIAVTFSEDISDIGSFRVNDNTVAVKDVEGAVVTLTLGAALNIGATVEVLVEYKGQTDVAGNEVKEWTSFKFKVADDTTIPTTAGRVEPDNAVTLAFSKAMTKDEGKIIILDKDGREVTSINVASLSSGQWSDGYTILKLTAADVGLSGFINAESFKVVLEDMRDASLRMTRLPRTSISLKTNDTKPPEVLPYFTVKRGSTANDDTITFYFSEAVDAATARNLSNYTVNAGSGGVYNELKALSAYGGVSFGSISSDGKSVTIRAKSIAQPGEAGLKIRVIAIRDLLGNMIEFGPAAIVSLTDQNGPFITGDAEATGKTTVSVTFDKDIGSISPSALALYKGGLKAVNVVKTTVNSDDRKIVELTLAASIGTDPGGYELWVVRADLIKDSYGVVSTMTNSAWYADVKDRVAPVMTIEAGVNSIIFKFSEQVKAGSIGDVLDELMIIDKDGARVSLGGADITFKSGEAIGAFTQITASNAGKIKGGETYRIMFLSNNKTRDQAGNSVTNIATPVPVTVKK